MQETEVNLKDLLCCALRKWRKIVVFAIVCAILAGSFAAGLRILDMRDSQKAQTRQAEYEIAYAAYWTPIHELERKISENERLIAQVQLSIDKLAGQETEYGAQIADLEAKIVYQEALIEDYKANIEQLKSERDNLQYYLSYRQEQNENSLLMKIDPYEVNVYDAYLRIDSGYEILPGNAYQNPNPTAELQQTYCLLVSNTNFYNKMISDLALDTEVRYLTEVISVTNYNANSLRIHVISDDPTWSKRVGEYIVEAIQSEYALVSLSIAEHDLVTYSTNSFTIVDLDIYTKQSTMLQQALDYEADIRSINTSILHTEADIRDIQTDIRALHQQIEETQAAITRLPLDVQALEQEIDGYQDANLELRTEQLALKKVPEPQYEEHTVADVLLDFTKAAVIGGLIGAIVAAIYFVIIASMGNKVCSSKQLCKAVNSEFFGFWPRKNKKWFAFADRWIARLAGSITKGMTAETATELVLSNIKLACKESKKILLCGGATKETVDAITCAIKEVLPEAQIISGGTLAGDPAVVRGLYECDAIILAEQLDRSDLNAAVQLKDRAQAMNKAVLGVVLL